ncbi:MAG: DNA ligase [Pseudomonadota bacterium]|nr:DNA ligase [Pseudomonadota bacterium]
MIMSMRRSLLLAFAGAAAFHPSRALAAWAKAAAREAREAPPLLLLAQPYGERIDPALCLVSEKYDGVRAHWDGSVLRHRSGRPVAAPAWFVERLPSQPLDGELWFGRGRFDALSAVVRAAPPDDAQWRSLRYLVFELPGASGTFVDRARSIQQLVGRAGWPQLQAVEQTRIAGREALRRRLDETVARGGEGLVLHLASAAYTTGRSDVLTKLKPYLDAEATVVGYRRGQGKYDGDVGALQVENDEGQRFYIGSGLPDALRKNPPPKGSVITYRYHDRTGNGVPRFASFLRRHEVI